MGSKAKLALALLSISLLPKMAMASIGPESDISPFAAFWGLILGVVIALGIILFLKTRMILRKRKTATEGKKAGPTAENPAVSEADADNKT